MAFPPFTLAADARTLGAEKLSVVTVQTPRLQSIHGKWAAGAAELAATVALSLQAEAATRGINLEA